MSKLAIPRGKKVKKPLRDPDMLSKRDIPYWFAPEWVRIQSGSVGRIIALKDKKTKEVDLHMLSKEGNVTYIQGSIQREFQDWHTDNKIDCILLGVDEDEIIETGWEYE